MAENWIKPVTPPKITSAPAAAATGAGAGEKGTPTRTPAKTGKNYIPAYKLLHLPAGSACPPALAGKLSHLLGTPTHTPAKSYCTSTYQCTQLNQLISQNQQLSKPAMKNYIPATASQK